MLGSDDARCMGKLNKLRTRPLPCCVQCERRIWPSEAKVVMAEFTPVHVMTEWRCDGHIPYSSGVAFAALQPAGASNGPAGSL